MCQGCEDMMEYDRAIDALIAKELPRLLNKPIDHDILNPRPACLTRPQTTAST